MTPKPKKPGKPILQRLDLSKLIAHHVVGHDHTKVHRRTVGFIIAVLGVGLVFLAKEFSTSPLAHFFGDLFGYFLHAVGAIPFLKYFESEN